jgi:magnesium-transporting ATPase (P-type)
MRFATSRQRSIIEAAIVEALRGGARSAAATQILREAWALQTVPKAMAAVSEIGTTATARSAAPNGLTSEEAKRRLERGGPNAIADVARHPVRRAIGKLWAPVPWMLEAAIVLQLGLKEYVEAGVVTFLLLFNAALGFIQGARAQAKLDALKSRLALVATARRDGNWISVPATTLVPGDVVELSLGSVVGADVRLVDGLISLDQSMLTGESLPVEAGAGAETYAGALVRRGESVAEVIATGSRKKFGRTAELVRGAKAQSSQQKALFRVVRNLAFFNGATTLFVTVYALLSDRSAACIVRSDMLALSIPAYATALEVPAANDRPDSRGLLVGLRHALGRTPKTCVRIWCWWSPMPKA